MVFSNKNVDSGDGLPPKSPEEVAEMVRDEALKQSDLADLFVEDIDKFVHSCEQEWISGAMKVCLVFVDFILSI